jgi:gas vesicle protein
MRAGLEETMADEQHNVAFMIGVILGALAAAIAVLFLTPIPGRETREQLAARLAGLLGENDG